MTFRIGQKVVCVDDSGGNYSPWPISIDSTVDGLTKNRVYHIRRVGKYRGAKVVWLAEINRGRCSNHPRAGEVGFARERFRPLIERKTDISIFTEILHNTKSPITEKVQ